MFGHSRISEQFVVNNYMIKNQDNLTVDTQKVSMLVLLKLNTNSAGSQNINPYIHI